MRVRDKRREEGAALLVAVMILAMLGMIALAALQTVSLDQQVAGFQGRQQLAFYAAEAGLSEGLATLEVTGTPDVVATNLGDAALYPAGQPSYSLDPTTPNPIEDRGASSLSGMNLQIGQGGGSQYQMRLWKIRVEGRAPGGSVSRLEMVAGRFSAN